ncbi:MAG: M81 family metallopeptidase [Gammaproteobacteria bacterium]|nr:M81 family metallopeptidase [Gammaproteobacteria bacterium]
MRLFVCGVVQETNVFSPIPTGWDSFIGQCWDPRNDPEPPENVNLLAYGGAVERACRLGIEVVPGLFLNAIPAAPASASCWQRIRERILDDLRKAGRVDAVFVFLHGAMSAMETPDCEGDLLQGIREQVGAKVPIAAVCDLHGNVSAAMLDAADFLICCREYPHVDFAERGAGAVDLLKAMREGRIRPACTALRVPLMTVSPTTFGRMSDFVSQLRSVEESGGVLSASAFHGFFGADHEDVGAAIVVITNDDPESGEQIASQLAQAFVDAVMRQGNIGVSLDEALREAAAARGRVVIAERADNSGGGAGGDSTVILAELLRRGVDDTAFGVLWDPISADFCHLAGPGSRISLRLGGKVGPQSGSPLDVEAEVLGVADDVHQQWFGRGKPTVPLGRSAAIRVGGVDVVIGSERHQVFSRHVFEGHGIDLEQKKVIVVKSTQHFAKAYAPLGQIIYCDTPGTVTMDFSTLPYRNLKRPVWPLDDVPIVPRPLWPPSSTQPD